MCPRVAARGYAEPPGKPEPADLKPAGIGGFVWGINYGELTLIATGVQKSSFPRSK